MGEQGEQGLQGIPPTHPPEGVVVLPLRQRGIPHLVLHRRGIHALARCLRKRMEGSTARGRDRCSVATSRTWGAPAAAGPWHGPAAPAMGMPPAKPLLPVLQTPTNVPTWVAPTDRQFLALAGEVTVTSPDDPTGVTLSP